MKTSEFLHKLSGRYLWLNILAMGAVVVLMIVLLQVGLSIYTHHGESIPLPDVRQHKYEAAAKALEDLGMRVEVSDTGYVKALPPGTVLTMIPAPGTRVKSGRVIYITVNAVDSPTMTLPDLVDNSSLREAQARLTAMGFKLGEPKYVSGEKDWVYGILVNGRSVVAGQKVPVDAVLVIQVGNGQRNAEDSVYMTDAPTASSTEEDPFSNVYSVESNGNTGSSAGDVDNFEVVE